MSLNDADRERILRLEDGLADAIAALDVLSDALPASGRNIAIAGISKEIRARLTDLLETAASTALLKRVTPRFAAVYKSVPQRDHGAPPVTASHPTLAQALSDPRLRRTETADETCWAYDSVSRPWRVAPDGSIEGWYGEWLQVSARVDDLSGLVTITPRHPSGKGGWLAVAPGPNPEPPGVRECCLTRFDTVHATGCTGANVLEQITSWLDDYRPPIDIGKRELCGKLSAEVAAGAFRSKP